MNTNALTKKRRPSVPYSESLSLVINFMVQISLCFSKLRGRKKAFGRLFFVNYSVPSFYSGTLFTVVTLILCIRCISIWIEVILSSVTTERILASFEKRAKQIININSQKTFDLLKF